MFWITEYEPHSETSPFRKVQPPHLVSHANTCTSILGVVVGLTEEQLSPLLEFCELKKGAREGLWMFADGGCLWTQEGIAASGARVRLNSKRVGMAALVIECESLATFVEKAKPDYETELGGRRAYGIDFGDLNYDLLVVERERP